MSDALNDLTSLISTLPERRYGKDGPVYAEGGRFRGVFAIVSGAVKRYRLTEDGDAQITGFYLPGELLGLDDLPDGPYTAHAQCLGVSSLRRLSPGLLATWLSQQSHALTLCTLLSETLRRNKLRYFQMSQLPARARLASFFVELSYRCHLLTEAPLWFRLPMARGDIANYLGLTPETVSRETKKLQRQGYLCFHHQYLTFLHREQLSMVAYEPLHIAPHREGGEGRLP